MRIRILCLLAALLAAAPVLWAVPAHAVIQPNGENRGPGGGDDRGGDDDDDDDDVAARAVPAPPGAAAPGATATGAPPAAGPGPVAVSILDGAFSPAAVSVAAGNPVTWTNTDGSRHTVTADTGAFDSGSMSAGATFAFTFPSPGTFAYFCAFHSEMQGTVTVGAPAGAAASPAPAPPTTVTTAASTSTTVAAASASAGAPATVEVRDYEFTPARLTVGRGTEVTWRNTGGAPHTVTGDGFDSGELTTGQTFARRFDTPGSYDYICNLHPRMKGVVEVVADATAAPVGSDIGGFPLERVAAGSIIGAPILLFAGAAMFFRGRH